MPGKPLAQAIGKHGDCCSRRECKERNCKVILPPGKRWCLNGTAYQKHHPEMAGKKLCDCMVLWSAQDGHAAAAVELKSGRWAKASEVHEQLQNGAEVIEALADTLEDVRFLPVLAHNNMQDQERRVLDRYWIRFRKTRYKVIVARSGVQLATLR